MRHVASNDFIKRLPGAAFLLAALLLCGAGDVSADTLRVTWASNIESDLAGYRLRFGTQSGMTTTVLNLPATANQYVADIFEPGLTYYFSLQAFDLAGNVSPPSVEVSARVPVTPGLLPNIISIFNLQSRSFYAIRGVGNVLAVSGLNLQPEVSLDFGPDISVNDTTQDPNGGLIVRVDVSPSASLGPRLVTATNPDGGIGSNSNALEIVKSPDFNRDCAVDILDLNTLARAWNERAGEANFSPEADEDGDGFVGPNDLTIFVTFLGQPMQGCS
jgi:hypothetical protein